MAATSIHENITDDSQKHMPFGYSTQILWDGSRARTSYLSLSSAQILALNSSPIDIVVAPGADKIIQPVSLYGKYTHVTTAYTFGGTLSVYLFGIGAHITINNNLITTGSDYNWLSSTVNVLSSATDFANRKNIVYATANPTGGDGTLELWYTYRVIDRTIS